MVRLFFLELLAHLLRKVRRARLCVIVFLCLFLSPHSFSQNYGWTKTWDFEFQPARIFFIDSLYGWVSGNNICRTSDGGNTWSCYFPHGPAFVFLDRKTGWAFNRYGEIAKSTDSCKTWKKVTSYYKLDFVDASAGNERNICAIGKTDYYPLDDTTKLIRSTDGGATWSTQVLGIMSIDTTLNWPGKIQFVDSTHVWLVGGGSNNSWMEAQLFWSNDAGKTFRKVFRGYRIKNVETTNPSVYFLDTLIGYCGTRSSDGDDVYKTTDGGRTWNFVADFTHSYRDELYQLYFTDEQNGWTFAWIADVYPGIYHTTDGGRTWKKDAGSFPTTGRMTMHSTTLGWAIMGKGFYRYELIDRVNTETQQNTNLSLECYPNPFNSTLRIRYSLKEAMEIAVCIYNQLGQRMGQMEQGMKQAGAYTINYPADHLSSGVYFISLETRAGIKTRQISLIK